MTSTRAASITSGGGAAISKSRGVLQVLKPLLCLFLVSGSLLTSPSAFAHRDVFTNTYTLGATKPRQFTASPSYSQSINTTAVYTLTVQNGATDGSNRITRGEVLLEGVVVIPGCNTNVVCPLQYDRAFAWEECIENRVFFMRLDYHLV